MSKNSHKQDFWFNHISCHQNSNLTQKEYCKREGLKFNTFVFWRMKFLKRKDGKSLKEKAIAFIPAIIKQKSIDNYGQKDNSSLSIILPNQVKLSMSGHLAQAELLDLIRALGRLT